MGGQTIAYAITLGLIVAVAAVTGVYVWQQRRRAVLSCSILATVPDAIVVLDALHRIADLNPAAERLLGCSLVEAAGQPLALLLPVWNELLAQTDPTCVGGKEVVLGEGTRRRNYLLHVSPVRGRRGKLVRQILLWEEITGQRTAEEWAQQQGETLNALLQAGAAILSSGGWEAGLRAFAGQVERLVGALGCVFYEWDQVESTILTRLVSGDGHVQVWPPDQPGHIYRLEHYPLRARALREQAPFAVYADESQSDPGEVAYLRRSGLKGLCLLPAVVAGRAVGLVELQARDPRTWSRQQIDLAQSLSNLLALVVENSSLYLELQQQADRWKQAQSQLTRSARLASIGELALELAEDLNNPLTSIQGFVELLMEETLPDTPSRHDLQRITAEVHRANDILRNLQSYVRPVKPHLHQVDLNRLLRRILASLRGRLDGRGVVVEEEYAYKLGAVLVDIGQIEQVFLNLVNNAIQAMPHGGTLRIRTGRQANEASVSITDTGRGIPPEVQERIFDPTFTTKASGMGLGLPVSMSIVWEHGGRITVQSEEGRGSTFTVWLPVEDGNGNGGPA